MTIATIFYSIVFYLIGYTVGNGFIKTFEDLQRFIIVIQNNDGDKNEKRNKRSHNKGRTKRTGKK